VADERPKFVCWGELLWDILPTGPELGGAAANVAVNLHRLGARPLLVSRVGSDTLGDRAIDQLNRLGLDTSCIQRDPTSPTGTVNVALVAGEPAYEIASESAWDRLEWQPRLKTELMESQAIVYGTLAQRTPLVREALSRLVGERPDPCLAICDLNLRPPHVQRGVLDAALAQADVVKLNEQELGRVGAILGTTSPIQRLFDTFAIRIVAATRGNRGCSLYTRAQEVHHAGYPLLAGDGDCVGAGDAFTAVLALELARGSRLEQIATKANDHARRVASARGAFGFAGNGAARSGDTLC
jgi:fructokinase